MRVKTRYAIMTAVVVATIAFIAISIQRASKREEVASPPILYEAPIVVYGTLEPVGKAVSVSPKLNGIVKEVHVQEGDVVQRGRPLCTVEHTSQNAGTSLLPVTAPQDGIVYKCDLRIGEAFVIADRDRLLLGSPDLQICCDVEILWIGKIDRQGVYDVLNAENEELMGTATFRSASRHLRPKSVRTEEPGEKAATQYQEVIMSFKPSKNDLPIGLPVMLRIRRDVK